MEQIMNATYPGLQMMMRDSLVRESAQRYAAGQLLRDERAVAGSFYRGGILQGRRFAIFSNRLERATAGWEGAQWAMATVKAGARYKVLDIYRRTGGMQITLLHLPEEGWAIFKGMSTNVDDLLIDYARKRFDADAEAAPAAALEGERWRKLCIHPVGMTDFGQAFPLQ